MTRLVQLLDSIDPDAGTRLPLAPTPGEYRRDLRFFAELFRKLANVQTAVEEVTAAARSAGVVSTDRKEFVALEELEDRLRENPQSPDRAKLEELAARLRRVDVRGLTSDYWNKVYKIYDVIPHPADPRAEGATAALFAQFHCPLATAYPLSPLEQALRGAGKPFVLLHLGRPGGLRGWKVEGWTLQGEDGGETWQASFDQPGRIARDRLSRPGLSLAGRPPDRRPAGRPQDDRGERSGDRPFCPDGPCRQARRKNGGSRASYPIPPGLLKPSGRLEIRFTEPGIAISEVALTVAPVPDADH